MSKQHSKRSKRKGIAQEEVSSKRLLSWATDELDLDRDMMPSCEDLNTLLRGSTGNSWDYICEHIHSQATTDVVKQNLSLHSGMHSTEHAQLLAERNELLRELSSLEVAVTQTVEDTSRLEVDIVSLEATNQVCRAELQEMSNKSTLLSAHSLKCQETVNILSEFTKRIQQREELFRYPERETSYFKRESLATPMALESACMREVRQVCKLVGEMVCSSDNEGQRLREQAWSKVESLLSSHPPHDVLQSLTDLTAELAQHLHSHTEDIDLVRDAQELRYQFNGDQGSSLLQSVEDHLTTAQLDHVTRAQEAEEAWLLSGKAEDGLDEVKGQLEECLQTQCTMDDPIKELMRSKLHLDLDVCGLEGVLSVLSQFVSQLQSSKSAERRGLKVLNDKKRRVEQFASIAESNQLEIHNLVRQNSSLKGHLQNQCTELNLYVRQNVCEEHGPLLVETRSLLDSVSTEVQLFSTVSLLRATMAPRLNCQSCDLSVHCLSPHQPSGCTNYQELLPLVSLCPYSAPETILPDLIQCLSKEQLLNSESARLNEIVQSMRKLAVDNKQYEDVLTSCESYDQQLRTVGLESVKQCLSLASHGLSRCSNVERTMTEWWEQPAQYCVPWVTCESMSCDKWIDQWRVLTAKLRQLTAKH